MNIWLSKCKITICFTIFVESDLTLFSAYEKIFILVHAYAVFHRLP